jgi:multidrug efflux pump subunit AcrA (membrane-fusion protein)
LAYPKVSALTKGCFVVSLDSINSLQTAVASAQRKVQQDRDQVAQDEDRLDSSRAQLQFDTQTLSKSQQDSSRAQAAAAPTFKAPHLDNAIEQRVPPNLLPTKPTLNAQGQTIGKLIHFEA